MSKNEIIEQLFHNKQINECISKMEPAHIQDDLKSEVLLSLLMQPEQKIIDLHERGELVFFTIRAIMTTIKSPRSKINYGNPKKIPFPEQYNDYNPELLSDRINRELREEPLYEIILKIKNLVHEQDYQSCIPELAAAGITWYQQRLLSEYMTHGSYRELEKVTWIKHESCFKTIKKTIIQLRKYVGIK